MIIKSINAEFIAGTDINQALKQAKEYATKYDTEVNFSFNSKLFKIDSDSDIGRAGNEYFNSIKTITGKENISK